MFFKPFQNLDYLNTPLNVATNMALAAGVCTGAAAITYVAMQTLGYRVPFSLAAASIPLGGAAILSVSTIVVATATVTSAATALVVIFWFATGYLHK